MAEQLNKTRTADPWRDTDVIDEHAPRFNQAVTGLVALLGALFGWPLAWALMSLQLLLGLTLGRRFCLPCLAFFTLVQPRIGEGRLEDSRPPRLANMIGTQLQAAKLTQANLTRARLTKADLTGADLTGVDLTALCRSTGSRASSGRR